jgi:hypothetical protein
VNNWRCANSTLRKWPLDSGDASAADARVIKGGLRSAYAQTQRFENATLRKLSVAKNQRPLNVSAGYDSVENARRTCA